MVEQDWLDGEVEVLDGLIGMFGPGMLSLPLPGWELYLAYAFMQAIRFYIRANHGISDDALEHLWNARDNYEAGTLTRDTLKFDLMGFDRFAKRVKEREVA